MIRCVLFVFFNVLEEAEDKFPVRKTMKVIQLNSLLLVHKGDIIVGIIVM